MQSPRSTVHLTILAGTMCSLLIGCASAPQHAALGETRQTAIEVCKPGGQREYLSRLVCSGGDTPTFKRLGSVGMRDELPDDANEKTLLDAVEKSMSFESQPAGSRHFHAVDQYELTCGAQKHLVFMDMYHCGVPAPKTAPPGLSLRPKP